MTEGQSLVFFMAGPTPSSPQLQPQLEELLARCQASLAKQAGDATFIVGLGDVEAWPELDPGKISSPIVYAWFEHFQEEAAYEKTISRFSRVNFLHGPQGLVELTTLLERSGVLKVELKTDPLAEDVFFRLKGEYLQQLEEDLNQSFSKPMKNSSARAETWQTILRRIAGSAGTYEFEALSNVVISALDTVNKESLSVTASKELRKSVDTSISEELENYRRQVEECLPTLVELDVRQRVLVLVDDAQTANQLHFALSHSRIQTVFHDNPAAILSALHTVQPDILVVQQSMRCFNGLDLASYVRQMERFEALPILALIEQASEETLARATRGGVDAWLTIPFSAANVALSVLNLLHRVEVARKLGGRDALTGLYTKEAMIDRLEGDLSRVSRSGQQISVMLIHIKDVDSPRLAFLDITSAANRVFRRSDLLARYNEATLAVILPGIDTRTIVTVISRFRMILGDAHPIEIVASIADGTATPEAILADAEIRLTQALGGSTESAIGLLKASIIPKANTAPKILIADTDEAIVNLLRFFCGREGFEVDDIRNGTDTVAYLEKAAESDRLPEVLILEAFLPGIDGFQILEKVQNDFGSRISVIMLSVSPSEERIAKAFKLGATDFIAKPFRVPEIIARIRNGLIRTCAV